MSGDHDAAAHALWDGIEIYVGRVVAPLRERIAVLEARLESADMRERLAVLEARAVTKTAAPVIGRDRPARGNGDADHA